MGFGEKKRILPQMGFGGRSWGTKLRDEAGGRSSARASAGAQITVLKNPLGPHMRVLAVWGTMGFGEKKRIWGEKTHTTSNGLWGEKNAYYLKWALGAEAGSRKGISL